MSTYTKYTPLNPTPSGFDYVANITSLMGYLDADFTLESNRIDTLVTKTSGINATGDVFTGDFTGNASSAAILQNARTINGVSFNGSANININTYIGATNPSADTSMYPVLVGANTVTNQVANTDAAFVYNSTTKALTATTFIGNLTGDVTGTASNAALLDSLDSTAFARLGIDNTYTANQNFRGFTESTGTIALTGADTLNTDLYTYFYHASASTGINTITLSTTAATGRLVTVTLAVNNWGTYAPSFVSNILWSGNVEPAWSTGIDVVSFSTRDGGTTWHGFYAGRDMS